MVTQYPHTLSMWHSTESIQDPESGDFISGESIELPVGECRAEINGGGKIIFVDGEAFVFHYIVYLPSSTPIIPIGSRIKVTNGDTEIFNGSVVRISEGQLNTRLWV